MDEFFSPLTDNSRKREIEQILGNFSSVANAWRDCLYFMENSRNEYVAMFCLTTLEQVIQKRWFVMVAEDKNLLRKELHNMLVTKTKAFPPFIRKKLMKLIVDIAKVDWPHFYPDFFPQIMHLIQDQETSLDGLHMLLIACEELGAPREDISSSRVKELQKLMLQQVSHISLVLTNILESVLDASGLTATSNRPSPSSSVSGDSDDSNSIDGSQFLASSIQESRVVGGQVSNTRISPVSINIEQQSLLMSSLCLMIFSQMFSWADLQTAVNSRVINALLHFGSLVVRSKQEEAGITDISVLAITAVNEIMAKNYVPHDFQGYLYSVYRGILILLQGLTVESECNGGTSLILSVDESYLERMTDFLKLFVSAHLKRCEDTDKFPLLDLLSCMFTYTMMQPNITGFSSCLEAWGFVVDYIQGAMTISKEQGETLLNRYKDALLSLVFHMMKKLQFRLNSSQLLQLDNTTSDQNNETEWQVFIVSAIEILMKVAELLPPQVLSIIDTVWKETCNIYLGTDKLVHSGNRIVLESGEDATKLQYTLRDFSTLLQVMGRMSFLFIGEYFLDRLQTGMDYIKQLLALASFGSTNKIYLCSCNYSVIVSAFLEAHVQTLATLKAWCHWLAALHCEALSDSTYTWVSRDITSSIVSAVVSVLKESENELLVHAGAHFLVTLTATVRPPIIWKLKEFTALYTSIKHLRLKSEAHRLLVRSLCNVLLLPWPGIQEQKWEERRKHLTKFLRDITEDFRNLCQEPNFGQNRELQKQAEPIIIHTLLTLGDLVDNVLNEVTQTKKLCHDTLREYIDISLYLFPYYIQNGDVCEYMFNFFHTVFDVLKTQMGASYVEQAVQTFLNLFGQNQLTQAILHGGAIGSRVVDKFLTILAFIVSEPGPSFRKFVPGTLSLVLDNVFPLVLQRKADGIKATMYQLLYQTLLHNWQFFFKSTLKLGNKSTEVENGDVFIQVMRCFGQSFMDSDIHVFRQNVISLEHLNQKWALYTKQIFVQNLMAEFLSVFFQVLIAKSHNLLREEIAIAAYNMAATDFPAFFDKFLPHFLRNCTQQLIDENQQGMLVQGFAKETDLPSFVSNLAKFVNDVRFYQTINSSLPSATVNFT